MEFMERSISEFSTFYLAQNLWTACLGFFDTKAVSIETTGLLPMILYDSINTSLLPSLCMKPILLKFSQLYRYV
jgi:hypothetical protein